MVAPSPGRNEPTRRGLPRRPVPLPWRIMLMINRGVVRTAGRVEVTGTIPAELRDRPLLIAANHIGVFDPFVLMAACSKAGVAPRFMLAGGLLRIPVIGPGLRRSGHIRVDRRSTTVAAAFDEAVHVLRDGRLPLLVYPEGRISHDPGLWPERGKTGVARMALRGDIPVLTISQWGAHEAVYWGTEEVSGWRDVLPLLTSWWRSVLARRVFRVHFGELVDLGGLTDGRPGDAMRAHQRIMRAITENLVPLRADEPDVPAFHDPTRPTDSRSPWRPAGRPT